MYILLHVWKDSKILNFNLKLLWKVINASNDNLCQLKMSTTFTYYWDLKITPVSFSKILYNLFNLLELAHNILLYALIANSQHHHYCRHQYIRVWVMAVWKKCKGYLLTIMFTCNNNNNNPQFAMQLPDNTLNRLKQISLSIDSSLIWTVASTYHCEIKKVIWKYFANEKLLMKIVKVNCPTHSI